VYAFLKILYDEKPKNGTAYSPGGFTRRIHARGFTAEDEAVPVFLPCLHQAVTSFLSSNDFPALK